MSGGFRTTVDFLCFYLKIVPVEQVLTNFPTAFCRFRFDNSNIPIELLYEWWFSNYREFCKCLFQNQLVFSPLNRFHTLAKKYCPEIKTLFIVSKHHKPQCIAVKIFSVWHILQSFYLKCAYKIMKFSLLASSLHQRQIQVLRDDN